MVLSVPLVRRLSFELFLRTHQALAFLSAFALWRLLFPESLLNRICIYVFLVIFSFTSLLEIALVVYRNRLIQGVAPTFLSLK